jgi:shikimate dehydrogenase
VIVSRCGEVNYTNVGDHGEADILVNTTPVGMYPENGISPVDLSLFPTLSGVIDVIYNPLKTALLLAAEERGIPCTGGLYMLVAQAKAAAELFTGEVIGEDRLQAVYRKVAAELTNIVLIGMPGCGKSRIGRELTKLTGRRLVDTDQRIRQMAKMTIPEIFEKHGEEYFRQLEAEVIAECGKRGGLILATGGGVVVTGKNRDSLRQNGRVYYIRRPLPLLAVKGRPLSKSPEVLAAMAREREPKYQAFSDRSIENDRRPEDAAKCILEDFYEASCH